MKAGDSRTSAVPQPRGHRDSRRRGGRRQHTAAKPPDLAAVARQAVVSFLHDESPATAERGISLATGTVPEPRAGSATAGGLGAREGVREAGIPAAGEPGPGIGAPAASVFEAQAAAVEAAALSVATLDRIESAAARLEQDITAALQEQADLQAGAGTAAEKAVRAAQAAWRAAADAEESSSQARTSMRKVGHYLKITVILVAIQLIIAVLFAVSAH